MAEIRSLDLVSTEVSRGLTLIEASAGTGKTYAISMLVLRAVAELGVAIDKILIVTFTVAATEELRERIRSRLLQGREALKEFTETGGIESLKYDETLAEWSRNLANPQLAIERLEIALIDIDQASIHTIHGFCQRILTEYPLECGEPFQLELLGNVNIVKDQLVKDYWRHHFYHLEESYCNLIIEEYPTPAALYSSIRGADDILAELVPQSVGTEKICRELDELSAQYRSWWDVHSEELKRGCESAFASKYFKVDFQREFATLFGEFDRCMKSTMLPSLSVSRWLCTQSFFDSLSGSRLRSEAKKSEFLEQLVLPGILAEQYLEAVENYIREVRLDLALDLRSKLSGHLASRGKMSFDDLVIRLDRTLSADSANMLLRVTAKQYDMALIDEFQDTDSAQWRIFEKLFGAGKHYFYLIGDPKQSIYRFRGADIYSYFLAREKASSVLTINKNYRSHPQLMDNLNELFEGVEIGGYLYRRVEAARNASEGCIKRGQEDYSGLLLCQLGEAEDGKQWYAGAAHDHIRNWISNEIEGLIGNNSGVRITEGEKRGSEYLERMVKPSDIAILVRSNEHARQYQDRLSGGNIPSVVASKTSVFSTPECTDLLRVVRAVMSPGDSGFMRTALGCIWFGLSGNEHYLICSDEQKFSEWTSRFRRYSILWQEHGFLTMFNDLLAEEEVLLHLCKLQRGERIIANIQHLGELIQEAESLNHFGVEQTIHWLEKTMVESHTHDDTELRLESDEDAVTIVTMHSAKGLEYPIVFCPYLLSGSRDNSRASVVRFHDDDNRMVVDIGSDEFDQNKQLEREELYDEDVRLAYVAATRAKLCCYLFWADIRSTGANQGSFSFPIGRILFPDGPCSYDDQEKKLRSLAENCQGGYRLISPVQIGEVLQLTGGKKLPELRLRKKGERDLRTNRTITSFSGLSRYSSMKGDVSLKGAYDESISSDSPPRADSFAEWSQVWQYCPRNP